MRYKHLVTIGVTIVIASAVWLVVARPVPATPPGTDVSWDAPRIEETVEAGQSIAMVVTATAKADLPDVVIHVVPELDGLVTAEPVELGDLSEGESVSLDITIAPVAAAPPGTFDGTIQLREAGRPSRVYARPLPIEIEIVWPVHLSPRGAFSLSYPASLSVSIFEDTDTSGHLSVKHPSGNPVFTVDWSSDYPEGTSLTDWADHDQWPTPDADWRSLYTLTTLTGREALQDPETGSTYIVNGNRVFHIVNGVGIDPVYVDSDTFNAVLESFEFLQ